MKKIPVAILGATGAVGQKFVKLLENHPWFEVLELVASTRSAGKIYPEAANWKQNSSIPEYAKNLTVKDLEAPLKSIILFSGLDSNVAGEAETRYAELGHWVISNSKNHRMDENVPLIIPEVNPDHLEMVKSQTTSGKIVTNSNCSTMFLAMVLAPLDKAFGVKRVMVTTMQAVSGAGYPGVPSLDILGNVVPYIGDEEPKMESEPQKILGKWDGKQLTHSSFKISAMCNRVAVVEGHTESVSVEFEKKPSLEEVKELLANFKGYPQDKKLPFAPPQPIIVMEEPDRPQPARDVMTGNGMVTLVGRIRPCSLFDIKMTILGHNTIRGAAGAAILNAETLVEMGYIQA